MSLYSDGCNVSTSVFYPAYSRITAITLGQQTVVTFSANHDFTVGEVVSFRVSKPFGTVELNNMQTNVSSITSNTITVPIDSLNFTPFVDAGQYTQNQALVVPSASGILPGKTAINLADSFDNKPPNNDEGP
jgi:hypothetical protein